MKTRRDSGVRSRRSKSLRFLQGDIVQVCFGQNYAVVELHLSPFTAGRDPPIRKFFRPITILGIIKVPVSINRLKYANF